MPLDLSDEIRKTCLHSSVEMAGVGPTSASTTLFFSSRCSAHHIHPTSSSLLHQNMWIVYNVARDPRSRLPSCVVSSSRSRCSKTPDRSVFTDHQGMASPCRTVVAITVLSRRGRRSDGRGPGQRRVVRKMNPIQHCCMLHTQFGLEDNQGCGFLATTLRASHLENILQRGQD